VNKVFSQAFDLQVKQLVLSVPVQVAQIGWQVMQLARAS
jgi:hypothetical protein